MDTSCGRHWSCVFRHFDDKSRYASLIGSLSYLAQMMRPDIMLTVRLLPQHVNNPSVAHWRTGKKLLDTSSTPEMPLCAS